MDHIITPREAREIGRPIGKVDDAQLNAYINEAEYMYVKPVLGDALFLDILDKGTDKYVTLLEGGSYEDADGVKHSFMGLQVAVSYFVYAQNVMSGDFQSTRYGMVLKDNDYSQHLSDKNRSDAYNNALEVANVYLKECLRYCVAMGYTEKGKRHALSSGSIHIHKIGR